MTRDIDIFWSEGCGRCSLGGTPDCKIHKWTNKLKLLRRIILETGLVEEIKWGFPCFTYQNKNILLLGVFKEFCTISFLKGALLKDPENILEKAGKNTQAARLIKYTNAKNIIVTEALIKATIFEAIEIEKSGQKVKINKDPEPYPEELAITFEKNPVLKNAFLALTPGRQRGYIIHFSQPKQSKTRYDRIEKCAQKILNGEGMHDHYQSKKR